MLPTIINDLRRKIMEKKANCKCENIFDIALINADDELRTKQPLVRYQADPSLRFKLPHKYDKQDPLGIWQFEYLRQAGLRPDHRLLEIGPGGFRLAQHLIGYLGPGLFYAAEISRQALDWGWQLLGDAERARNPQLYWGGDFSFHLMGAQFSHVWAHSVFTHLSWNHIGKCLYELRQVMADDGVFHATYFAAEGDPWRPQPYSKSGKARHSKLTYGHRDPYHYQFPVLQELGRQAGWRAEHVDLPMHPKGQSMLVFRLR